MPKSPTNPLVRALFTDQYQLTMAYAYFMGQKHNETAVFDLFFRSNPFKGEFALFAGLTEAVKLVDNFGFSDEDVDVICKIIPRCNDDFKSWLRSVDCSDIRLHAPREGSVVFPRIPLIRVEGPIAIAQLLESAMLNLIAYPTLVATNAARMRIAAGPDKKLVEFGLRRAQGPDGAVSAARYSYLGGFDATSNVLAANLFGFPASGTQAHSYIQSYTGLDDLKSTTIVDPNGNEHDVLELVLTFRENLNNGNTNDGELAAFIAYAQAFPDGFLALADTYGTLKSGVPNFLAVALALKKLGYQPRGFRLDSGDLAHLSKQARRMIRRAEKATGIELGEITIVASNEINEQTLRSLSQQGHEVDMFGVGTHLVTCQAQPSLGCVYKLVQIGDDPRIKISQEAAKTTIPGRKETYRLFGKEGYPLVDLMISVGEDPPETGKRVLCCHPFEEAKRAYVVPSRVEKLDECVWDGRSAIELPSIHEAREFAMSQLQSMREDHLRLLNPTPYKVSLSETLHGFMRKVWLDAVPVGEME